jgi:hypothetical protein
MVLERAQGVQGVHAHLEKQQGKMLSFSLFFAKFFQIHCIEMPPPSLSPWTVPTYPNHMLSPT